MKYFDKSAIEKALNYNDLIAKLEGSFQKEYQVPERFHFDYSSGFGRDMSTLLLMPAIKNEQFVGLKVITVSPFNSTRGLATIQGIYILMDAHDGQVIAQFDAKTLTNLRTAAASALASTFLSKKYSSSMLLLGTGALAPELIKAHCAVRPINKVWIWGRNFLKAKQLVDKLSISGVKIVAIENKEDVISKVDIISTATSSQNPVIFGKQFVPGQHIDLVGAFKPTWREADEEAILNSSVFVDTREGTLKESGELLIPMINGSFSPNDIQADLFDLCRKKHPGRSDNKENTVFISVGYALEDLAAAELIWKKYHADDQ